MKPNVPKVHEKLPSSFHRLQFWSRSRRLALVLAMLGAGAAALLFAVFQPGHFKQKWSYEQFVVYSVMFLVGSAHAAMARDELILDAAGKWILWNSRGLLRRRCVRYARFDECTGLRLARHEPDTGLGCWQLRIALSDGHAIEIDRALAHEGCPEELIDHGEAFAAVLGLKLEVDQKALWFFGRTS